MEQVAVQQTGVRMEIGVKEFAAMAARAPWMKVANAGEAVLKAMAGHELGIPPMASLRGIDIVKGNVFLRGVLMASLVKESTKYDYRVQAVGEHGASVEFFEMIPGSSPPKGTSLGVSEYGPDDAKRAGISNNQGYKTVPKSMYLYRAISQGVRWYCPDLLHGGPAYVPGEIPEHELEDADTRVIEQVEQGADPLEAIADAELERETVPAKGAEEQGDPAAAPDAAGSLFKGEVTK